MPQKETDPVLETQRKDEIESNKKKFRWVAEENNKFKGFPRYGEYDSDKLPRIFQRYAVRRRDFLDHKILGFVDLKIENFERELHFNV